MKGCISTFAVGPHPPIEGGLQPLCSSCNFQHPHMLNHGPKWGCSYVYTQILFLVVASKINKLNGVL